MRFYFCFGILLGFINLIIIPKFSTGMPSSGGSTSNNEDECPIASYYLKSLLEELLIINGGDDKAIRDAFETVVKLSKFDKDTQNNCAEFLQTIIDSGDEKKAIEDYAFKFYIWKKNNVDNLRQKLYEGDTKKDGTVTIDYAKKSLLECKIIQHVPDFDNIYDFIITQNLKDKHHVNYHQMLENFMVNMEKYDLLYPTKENDT
ncbi:uncharacterized protein LOC126901749 isoform X2 [Daktulosphaira vitifoliae]|uniref:uncharacterized protein LOC126901749 isoform X2 n=1 Tax=Daktulosphaira vitifoliae TaxID=58002 RepID=UPI0021AAE702|nr:uncharacterized protein LOC126901749 isoform X2 [Daktulosphaira vitifoliae]